MPLKSPNQKKTEMIPLFINSFKCIHHTRQNSCCYIQSSQCKNYFYFFWSVTIFYGHKSTARYNTIHGQARCKFKVGIEVGSRPFPVFIILLGFYIEDGALKCYKNINDNTIRIHRYTGKDTGTIKIGQIIDARMSRRGVRMENGRSANTVWRIIDVCSKCP